MADDAPETHPGGTVRPSRFAALPPRVPLEDLVEETDASTPPDEPTSDPNRDVANRWGFGMVGT